MTRRVDTGESVKPDFDRASSGRSPRRKDAPVTLRLTEAERQRLNELADGMTLSAYIRACLFAKEEKRRKRRAGSVVADKRAVAEALALLGQSRIASNLNQLAHQANIGALRIEEDERAKIAEAYQCVLAIRGLLVAALGKDR